MFTIRYHNNTENPTIGSLWVQDEAGYQLYVDRIDLTDKSAVEEVVATAKAEVVMRQEKDKFIATLVADTQEKFNA